MRPQNLPAWVALALGAMLSVPAPARACTCAQPSSAQAALEKADRVFLGTVERFEVRGARRVATFRVATVWKGPLQTLVAVTTGRGDADCGVHFVAGLDYLVYAGRGSSGSLETNICTRTAGRRDARADLDALGPGTPAAPASHR